MAELKSHSSVADLEGCALDALWSIAASSPAGKEAYAAAGAVPAFVNAIINHPTGGNLSGKIHQSGYSIY